MEKISINTYRKAAVTLWAAVSVAAGFTIGEMLDLSGRRTVFAVALTVGGYILAVVHMYKKADVRLEKSIGEQVNGLSKQKVKSSEKTYVDSADYDQPMNSERDEVDVEKMQKNDEEMTNKETREWLDKFLVRQQKGEKIKPEDNRDY